MRFSLFPCFFLITVLAILCTDCIPVHSQCLEDQRTLLLQLRNSFNFSSSISTKLVYWNQSTDCCHWNGVSCDTTGHVISLDLSSESISGRIENSSSLFNLQFLQRMNLANNFFYYTQIPSGFNNLTSLMYLNLSNAGFAGQVPRFSQLKRLVTLDLSTNPTFAGLPSLKLENPNLRMLVQNLTVLMELHLDGVILSAQGNEWCPALSASLPNLQVLSLSNCYLSGPIDSSLANLQSLSEIDLSQNNLTAPVPELFAKFSNLTVLRLSSCNLYGKFPSTIFQVPTLQTLDLHRNILLQGSLPEFPRNRSLQTLVLSSTNFSGPLPASIGNLGMLTRIEMMNCSFSGQLPNSMENLNQLLYLDLRYNSFSGSIPSSLFALPLLQNLQLSNNHFDGLLADFPNASLSQLDTLELSSNYLSGPIPMSLFELGRLIILSLSSNNLNDSIQLEMFQRLSNLIVLDLSYNQLSIDANGSNFDFPSFPKLTTLNLASCNLQRFPNLKKQSSLLNLDLSNNQIGGEIPNWIWEVGDRSLHDLNLSHNLLVGLQEPFVIPSLSLLDLHSNNLGGKIPIPPEVGYVDYSRNNFNSSIPADIGNNLAFANFFSASNNKLTGNIPESICNASYLRVLDLSNNSLSGSIPSCLLEGSENLGVLSLGENNLTGNISGTFQINCGLQTLDLHGNLLEGKVPESLENCSMLEVLNLGNNRINDTFPCFLKNSSNLCVLVLRSNMFYGGIQCQEANYNWPNLQIIDTSSNYFNGHLPPKFFLTLRAMMMEAAQSEINQLRFDFFYQDTVTVTIKGREIELVKILTLFTYIDFSNNRFEGNIPHTVGDLKSLQCLSLSNNALTGAIPVSIGSLTWLESLDLSVNQLSGEIPGEFTRLNFLSVLNFSYNQLVGKIPTGNQFSTFDNTSFEGNVGLCGLPTNLKCRVDELNRHFDTKTQIDWNWITVECGFITGLGIVVGSLLFCKRWREWYYKYIDHIVFRILHRQEQGRKNHGRRPRRNPIRRH